MCPLPKDPAPRNIPSMPSYKSAPGLHYCLLISLKIIATKQFFSKKKVIKLLLFNWILYQSKIVSSLTDFDTKYWCLTALCTVVSMICRFIVNSLFWSLSDVTSFPFCFHKYATYFNFIVYYEFPSVSVINIIFIINWPPSSSSLLVQNPDICFFFSHLANNQIVYSIKHFLQNHLIGNFKLVAFVYVEYKLI